MTFNVLKDILLETSEGVVILKQGQVIRLSKDEALPLIESGMITPAGRVAYRIYSNILEAFLWVVQDDAGAEEIRAEGITGAVYTGEEIRKLRCMDKEGLKAIHNFKEVFQGSTVKEANKFQRKEV